jgi:lactoylglutathione lyase
MPALLNLVVIYTADLERTARFYAALGLVFERERHGRGPEHLAAQSAGIVFEIYPASEPISVMNQLRLGFSIHKIDQLVEQLVTDGARLVTAPQDSPWGRRAVLSDWEGRRVELVEKVERDGRCC